MQQPHQLHRGCYGASTPQAIAPQQRCVHGMARLQWPRSWQEGGAEQPRHRGAVRQRSASARNASLAPVAAGGSRGCAAAALAVSAAEHGRTRLALAPAAM
mmetsp:Transcript_22528/g.67087  ORF Transcript_22528/g.67087 Transcript_22528/m.67087 type:complete len:101 (-) Transcript_22528:431-733(-)